MSMLEVIPTCLRCVAGAGPSMLPSTGCLVAGGSPVLWPVVQVLLQMLVAAHGDS